MLGNHAIHHCQDVGMIDDPTSRDIIAAFLYESRKASLLLGSVADGLRHKPRPAAPLLRDDLVDELQRFGVDTRGDDGMLGHLL